MANVLQYGKRGRYLPRITGGRICTRHEYADREDCPDLPDRVMPPMLYCVEVAGGAGVGDTAKAGTEYKAQFTEDEMIAVVGEWLVMLSRHKAEKKRKAKEYAARGQ